MYAKAAIILIVMILSAGTLMYQAWRGYDEKMEILYMVVERQGEGIQPVDIVTELLKGQRATDTVNAEQKLVQYGFDKKFVNRYKKSLYVSWAVILVTFCLISVGMIALFRQADRRRMRIRKRELLWLQDHVTALRGQASGSFQNKLHERAEDETRRAESSDRGQGLGGRLGSKQHILENYDEDLGRFLMELAALADSVELFRRQAETEREGTKALVTDISHQLKTPVAALKTSFEILQSGGLDQAEYQEFLERCGIQILRLEELVSALVNISRMEAGMIELKKEERKLFDTILLAVNRIYPGAEEKDIEIELEAEEELRQIRVLHDSRWLCEAFLNVLENAVKYSAARTRITIRMTRLTVYLRIEIEDEGIGIPRREWNRIFQRFYRGEAAEVQRETGSGVGLYLAREIVTRHEGTLAVTAPRRGKRGSCFVFQLPCM